MSLIQSQKSIVMGKRNFYRSVASAVDGYLINDLIVTDLFDTIFMGYFIEKSHYHDVSIWKIVMPLFDHGRYIHLSYSQEIGDITSLTEGFSMPAFSVGNADILSSYINSQPKSSREDLLLFILEHFLSYPRLFLSSMKVELFLKAAYLYGSHDILKRCLDMLDNPDEKYAHASSTRTLVPDFDERIQSAADRLRDASMGIYDFNETNLTVKCVKKFKYLCSPFHWRNITVLK